MTQWQIYTDTVTQHTVTGDVRVTRALHSPQLDNTRDIFVWLPPDYITSDRRYPVIYMHDGQNLFDAHVSNSGEWQADETMTALFAEGYAAIIVAVPNAGEARRLEYSPYLNDSPLLPIHDARGDRYLRFLIDTVKPLIDHDFRTLPAAASTGIAGSSMGG
ncbi:MAG: alpha/beta hydrolase, partial [Armatimonadetes bacterium]|nr:alpha/beta hydrolase [Anaerolineae bacterium]